MYFIYNYDTQEVLVDGFETYTEAVLEFTKRGLNTCSYTIR
jgi:hypothetical protein